MHSKQGIEKVLERIRERGEEQRRGKEREKLGSGDSTISESSWAE